MGYRLVVPPTPAPRGRPPEFKKVYIKLAYRFALAGLNNEDIAEELEVSIAQLKRWMKDYPEIRAAIKRGRIKASTKVVNALLKRALGYTETVTEDRILPNGSVVSVTNQRTEPGNVTAQIFWLKNRMRKYWYDESPRQATSTVDPQQSAKAVRDGIKAIKQLEGLGAPSDDTAQS